MKHNILVLFLLISLNLFSQKKNNFIPIENIKELEQKLNAKSAEINTIKSDFIQEKHLAFLNDTIITKGKFWFKKENQLRWEYTSPFEYIIVINSGKFIIKDEEKISEFDINSNQAFQEVNSLIISSVKGSLLEEDKFEIDAFENSTTYFVSLIPLDEEMKNILNKIELYFDISSLNISKVKMIENEDDYTIISFTNRKLNESVPANIFILN
ncbi:MAG: outer membrane lipoprotein carrier protein LolA [Bacteroidetes bacterium]|jgi:outer membrane lipoprotein-sorting protein|nr:outer membrane lipoprotein carrier protein LolA [Bacteroidota bacterium]MBT6686356.1 outer membrane lipoprotein carrier protein LolA [Bacteroidota bacterium]MBT7142189.1 outer membrane lipoprotein carrier protein LolA [Bacteroidota bacterium]MBT7490456.1 outer membrane lipoprotein carrier protein LolA [Bacteroidota bacterium]